MDAKELNTTQRNAKRHTKRYHSKSKTDSWKKSQHDYGDIVTTTTRIKWKLNSDVIRRTYVRWWENAKWLHLKLMQMKESDRGKQNKNYRNNNKSTLKERTCKHNWYVYGVLKWSKWLVKSVENQWWSFLHVFIKAKVIFSQKDISGRDFLRVLLMTSEIKTFKDKNYWKSVEETLTQN